MTRNVRTQAPSFRAGSVQAVYIEDLAVSGLARTRLAKCVHDAGGTA